MKSTSIFKWIYLAAVMMLMSAPVSGFIGNSILGKNLCVVGCGRGPLGIGPIGDVLQGANEFAFGPTLEAFEQKGRNIVDYASKSADAKLFVLDENLKNRLQELTELTQDSLVQLDEVLKSNINIGLEGLESKMAALDILGSRKMDELNAALRGIVLLASFAILAIWLAKYVAGRQGTLSERLRSAKWRFLGALIVFALIAIAPWFISPYRIPGIQEKLLASYQEEYESLDFPSAYFVANQLLETDPSNMDFLRKRDESLALRDVYYQPTSYKTRDGLMRIEARFYALLRINGEEGGAQMPVNTEIARHPDLEITYAMVYWQARQNMIPRFLAANWHANTIKSQLQLPVEERSSLLPLAIHYVNQYLALPLNPLEIDLLLEDAIKDKEDVYFSNFPIIDPASMRELASKAAAEVKTNTASLGQALLMEQMVLGATISGAYGKVVPNYMRMLKANFALAGAAPEAQVKHKAERDASAKIIINAWNELLLDKEQGDLASNLTSRLALVATLHATYSRAVKYLSADLSGNVAPVLTVADMPAVPLDQLFHERWLQSLEGAVRSTGIPLLRARARAQFLQDQGRLSGFETAFKAALSNPNDPNLALRASGLASQLGMFICTATDIDKKGVPKKMEMLECSETSNRVRALWYIRSLLPENQQGSRFDWRAESIESMKSVVPTL